MAVTITSAPGAVFISLDKDWDEMTPAQALQVASSLQRRARIALAEAAMLEPFNGEQEHD